MSALLTGLVRVRVRVMVRVRVRVQVTDRVRSRVRVTFEVGLGFVRGSGRRACGLPATE
jgi:hypothetical protein